MRFPHKIFCHNAVFERDHLELHFHTTRACKKLRPLQARSLKNGRNCCVQSLDPAVARANLRVHMHVTFIGPIAFQINMIAVFSIPASSTRNQQKFLLKVLTIHWVMLSDTPASG